MKKLFQKVIQAISEANSGFLIMEDVDFEGNSGCLSGAVSLKPGWQGRGRADRSSKPKKQRNQKTKQQVRTENVIKGPEMVRNFKQGDVELVHPKKGRGSRNKSPIKPQSLGTWFLLLGFWLVTWNF